MEGRNQESIFDNELLESIFRTSKKTIQEYVQEIYRHCRYRTVDSQVIRGTVLDDRGPLMDLYESCVQQDAHLRSVMETIFSQIIGERYMLASQNEKGKYIKNVEESKKVQGSQFDKIIRGIVESNWYGYTLLEIPFDINPLTGKLDNVRIIQRRNVLPDQLRVVKRQGQWSPGWDLNSPQYSDNYVLINTGDLGLFSATTPLILAKKFTLANYVNFSHTYGQPIIHGKTSAEDAWSRKKLADDIANAAENKVLVTGINDDIEVKSFSMSNSEHIYTGLIDFANKEVSNLMVGSESMAGATQSYVGSTNAHQDIFRERIETYREYIENVMNEMIIPRLIKSGYIKPGLEFKYSNRIEMNNKDKIALYSFLSERYEISPDEIDKEFGVQVGSQINLMEAKAAVSIDNAAVGDEPNNDHHIISDEEYFRRYGHERTSAIRKKIEAKYSKIKASKGKKEKDDSEYKAIYNIFKRYLNSLDGSQDSWDILEDMMWLRSEFAVDHAIKGFGMTVEDALDLLMNKKNLTPEEEEKRNILVAAIDNLVDFAVAEEFQMSQALPSVDEYEDTEEYEDDCEDICEQYNQTYADTENDDIEYAMGVAAGWTKYKETDILIYMTQGDDRVRPWHEDLEGLSYPKSSFPEWLIPPIEWGCRCYLEEDSTGTVNNKKNLDRFVDKKSNKMPSFVNPVFKESVAKCGRIFGKSHPYFDYPSEYKDKIKKASANIKKNWLGKGAK